MKRVAVIGAGPGGLVVARYLKSEGFVPTLFEQGSKLGGQWSGEPAQSGVWPSMRTNTSRVLTAFSDLPHRPGTPTYPTNQAMTAYLEQYARMFDLMPHIRFHTPVDEVRHEGPGWVVCTSRGDEPFDRVVVATGRYNKPFLPVVPGIESFSGKGGITHTFAYQDPDAYRGLRVVVCGCAISSLEIATDLVMSGAAEVTVTQRRQRYVVPKLVRGVPTEHLAFTRFAALADESLPPAAVAAGLKQFVLGIHGNPEHYGAPRPAENIREAGLVLSQYFLPMVAEGRITVRPWMEQVTGNTIRFSDGTQQQADALIFGTGFALHAPFLSEEIGRTLNLDAQHIDLYKHTFHPELPGLAFLGLYEQIGPYFPSIELQARWIAYSFSGISAMPSQEEMEVGIAAYRKRRGGPQTTTLHGNAILFSRAAGVEPDLTQWPRFARALLFGPLAPISFRLNGHDARSDAADLFAQEVRAFGCMTSDAFTPEQIGQLQTLAKARRDPAFSEFVETITKPKAESAGS